MTFVPIKTARIRAEPFRSEDCSWDVLSRIVRGHDMFPSGRSELHSLLDALEESGPGYWILWDPNAEPANRYSAMNNEQFMATYRPEVEA
jgi:hypothetical protein